MYLLDTVVLSELRKRQPHPAVVGWFRGKAPDVLYVSTITIGEIERGVDRQREHDPIFAEALASWLDQLLNAYRDRILPINVAVARRWGRLTGPHRQWAELRELKHWFIVLAATLPAIAAFFAISAEKRAYPSHFHSYALMGGIFGRALREAEAIPADKDDAEFQELVRDLGREALAENAEWLLDHRHRPIEHQ